MPGAAFCRRMGSSGVPVQEFYNEYRPPRYALRTVQILLKYVPEQYLRGLDRVVLTNQSGQSRRNRLGKVTSRGRRVPRSRVLGSYHPAYGRNPPWIELLVDNMEISLRLSWLPLFRQMFFGLVLFHEIGHHVDFTIRPEYREKEDVADDWRLKFLRVFIRKRYWYLVPVWRPVAAILRALIETR